MDIKKGQDRIVIIFPALKIVVKLPVVHLIMAIKNFWRFSKKWDIFKKYLTFPVETLTGLKGLLFRGFYSNWNEFWFHLKTHNLFLQPTYFSLFGLLNIQKYDEPCRLDDDNLWHQFIEIAGNSISQDPHHFYNHINFCVHKQKLRMLDYGSRKVCDIIARHGANIYEKFDLAHKNG